MMKADDVGWAQLCELVDRMDPRALEQPGVTEEWSVKDLLCHLACWWAEAERVLQQIRFGTYRSQKLDVDELNRQFSEVCKALDLDTVRAELFAARNRALEELWKLPEVTDDAREWFVESGPNHYEEHVPDLRRFVEETATRDASAG